MEYQCDDSNARMLLDAAIDALRDEYDDVEDSGNHLSLAVTAPDDDDDDTERDAIRALLGERYDVEWAGTGNTDADGYSTTDIHISVA